MGAAEWLVIAAVFTACLAWRLGHYFYWRTRFGGRPTPSIRAPLGQVIIIHPAAPPPPPAPSK